jgi:hypothetical protein
MKKSKATEALRVATDIAAIKAALHKRGYRLRKQPKQPVWKLITPQSPPTTKASVDAPPLISYALVTSFLTIQKAEAVWVREKCFMWLNK